MNSDLTPLLNLTGISKSYPGVIANSNVDLKIMPGETHALLGENGAGKSTLVKMIYGLVKPDSGSMEFDGNLYSPKKPSEARNHGLAMVFQHFTLFEAMTVAENIAVGMENPPNMQELEIRISDLSTNYGLPINPKRLIADLSAGERQRVEIIRCLLQNPRLFIMDEPTSVLTPQEVEILFSTLKQLSDEGTAILYISHKLEEIKTLCDAATILRGGVVVGSCNPKEETAKSMAELMVGSELALPEKSNREHGELLLSSKALASASTTAFGTHLSNIEFDLHAGSIFGIGGVAGNGQEELLAVLSGKTPTEAGSLFFKDQDISRDNINQRRRKGILSAPEERLGHAAAPSMSLIDNSLLTARIRKKLVSWGFINHQKTTEYTAEIIDQFNVKTPNGKSEAASLSGGNLQKFVVGRELLQNPTIFIVNQPTWGVDAAAAADIRNAIRSLTNQGAAAIVISQDLDELLEISDQFAVLAEGKLSATTPTNELTIEKIGLMMGGQIDSSKQQNTSIETDKYATA